MDHWTDYLVLSGLGLLIIALLALIIRMLRNRFHGKDEVW